MKLFTNNPQFSRRQGIDEKVLDEFEIETDQDGNLKLLKTVQAQLKLKEDLRKL